jgi:DNA-binding CsgD family transcriptional regulator
VNKQRLCIVTRNSLLAEAFEYVLYSLTQKRVEVVRCASLPKASYNLTLIFISHHKDISFLLEDKVLGKECMIVVSSTCSDSLKEEILSLGYTPVALEKAIRGITKRWGIDDAEERLPKSYLTQRENQILHLIAQGGSLKEISYELGISQHTVVAHKRSIYLKTGTRSVQQLTLYAVLHTLSKTQRVEHTEERG